MNVINRPVLALNAAWQSVGIKTVKDAFISLCGGDGDKNPPALALDMEFPVDESGAVDWDNPNSLRAVPWETWKTLPIRDYDLAIHSANMVIRVPEVVIQPNYHRMPMISPRPTKEAIRKRDGGICQYTGQFVSSKLGNIDHVQSRDKGGKNTFENMVWCHRDVNSKKANLTVEQAGLRLLRLPRAVKSSPISSTITVAHRPSWVHFLENVTEVRGLTSAVA